MRYDLPAVCARLLYDGEVDLGLVPCIEYLRRPDYRFVPGIGIGSRRAVKSVALYTRRDTKDIRHIALDTSSRTSVALTRVLSARVFNITPEFHPLGPDLPAMLAGHDAALLIGDRALLAATGPMQAGDREVFVEKIDLGEAWLSATGLPFVFALWVGRGGALKPEHVARLQQARDEGRANLETVSAEFFAGAGGAQPELVARGAAYLRDNIRHHLGEDERAGLTLFYRYAAETGVVPATQPLRFF